MFAKATLTAVAIAIAAPAFAMGTQLVRAAGVESGVFTQSELVLLNQALNDNDYRLYNFIVDSKTAGVSRSAANATSDDFVFPSSPDRAIQRASEQ